MNFAEFGISKNLSFGLLMLAPLMVIILTIVLVKALHKRSFAETVNGTKKLRWNRAFLGFAVWFLVMAAYNAVDYFLHQDNYVFQFDLSKFAVLLVLSIVLIPIQTTSEELLFRGYLAQGIGSGTRNRWLALIFPAILFGLIHFNNPEVGKFGFLLSMSQYIFFGLLFGLIAILDDGIEITMGMHAANNLFLCLFVTHSASALQTDAVFSVKELNPVADLVSLVLIGTIVFLFFYKKYKWTFSLMNKEVETTEMINDSFNL
jgi:membrane protease YdiL (CAAX protease family)